MDTVSHFDTPVTRTLAGEQVEFPRLTLDDLKAIGGAIRASREEAIERLAKQTRLSPWERFRALQELESGGVSLGDILRHGKTPEGIEAFVGASARRAGHGEEKRAAHARILGPLGLFSLASELVSVPESPPDEADRRAPEEAVPLGQ